MHTRDSKGRQISILNDDDPPSSRSERGHRSRAREQQAQYYSSDQYEYAADLSSPSLMRTDSYGSQNSDTLSPTSQPAYYNYASQESPYGGYAVDSTSYETDPRAPAPATGYDEESPTGSSSASSSGAQDRGAKRYPCRFRHSHGCDKTFTTSGHASRHARIHTAEKSVPCAFDGCPKKFTRSDNMKQHLETHYKKSGSSRSGSGSASASTSGSISGSSSQRRTSSSSTRPSTSAYYEHGHHHHHSSHYQQSAYATSPVNEEGQWDLGVSGLSINRPVPNGGLDALARVAMEESRRQ